MVVLAAAATAILAVLVGAIAWTVRAKSRLSHHAPELPVIPDITPRAEAVIERAAHTRRVARIQEQQTRTYRDFETLRRGKP